MVAVVVMVMVLVSGGGGCGGDGGGGSSGEGECGHAGRVEMGRVTMSDETRRMLHSSPFHIETPPKCNPRIGAFRTISPVAWKPLRAARDGLGRGEVLQDLSPGRLTFRKASRSLQCPREILATVF